MMPSSSREGVVSHAATGGRISEYFVRSARTRRLRDAAIRAIESVGPSTRRTTRSQVAFHRRRGFAWIWAPAMYLTRGAAPLVLSIAAPRRLRSRRWKEVVEPTPGRFMHHLEIRRVRDLDAEVRAWLQTAWENAA